MLILAIETSCDETAAAVVEDGWKVLSNCIASSLNLHQKTGGVVPEIAARSQIESIIPVIDLALKQALPKKSRQEQILLIDAVAVTSEPGLITSLLVGIETAKWLAFLWKKPLVKINHIKGHVCANWLERNPKKDPIAFPVVSLSVSGGHNDLMLLKNHDDWKILGETLDDAAGEAFDKIARVLGLEYPGGPEIEKIASNYKSRITNHELRIKFLIRNSKFEILTFPRAWLNKKKDLKSWDGSSFDFSFSGLKSEVIREVKRRKNLQKSDKIEIAYAFQEAVIDVLATKLIGAAKKFEAKEIHIAGGVSANKKFRSLILERMKESELNIPFRFPKKMIYCTDNAAMIGAAAHYSIFS